MGCGSSVSVGSGNGGGGDGKFEMFSDGSFGCLSTKVGGETYERRMNEDRRGGSKKICDAWGINKDKPFDIRYWKSGESPTQAKESAYGDITLGEFDNFNMLLASYLPIQAPCAKVKKSLGGPVVVAPVVYAVDLFVKVDGVEQTDGHVCCGEPDDDRAKAIEAAFKLASSDHDAAVRKMLEDGPPGNKPWATLFGKEFPNIYIVHLPLVWKGNLDDATYGESESYGGSLLSWFSQLLASIGPGKHDWEIRFAPRGVISGGDVLEGRGGFKGGGTSGIGLSPSNYYQDDPAFKALVDGDFAGQALSADLPGLTAMFSLDVHKKLCQGDGTQRQAPPFREHFNGDIDQHCRIAMGIAASGCARAAVSKFVGGSPIKPVHIVIPDSDIAGGITPMASQGGKEEGTRFPVYAFFMSSDPDNEDGQGAMVKFVCAKYTKRDHAAVASPKWEAEGTFGNSRDRCLALSIKNKAITAAIERDESIWNA